MTLLKPGEMQVHWDIDPDLKQPRIWIENGKFEVRLPRAPKSWQEIVDLINDWSTKGGMLHK